MYQNTVREESPVEVTTPSKRRQKRAATVRNEDVPRCTPWTTEEEIALCKGWVHVSENSAKGHRTYDMVNGEWKMVRPNVARFCGVHANVLRRAHDSGAGDEDYFNKALLDYEAEFGQVVPKYSNPNAAKKSKTSGSSSFNTESDDASFNLNVDVGDEDENEVQGIPRTMGRDKARGSKKKGVRASGSSVNINDEAFARLMVSELATQTASIVVMKKEERDVYIEIKRREVDLRERELKMQAYRQRQEDMRFYMQPYDHLTRVKLAHMEAMRAEIKAKYNLSYYFTFII
ncbi:hypothetical protein Tco_0883048 [Tanacetum coccineum]